jgi:acetyl-CoA carboxylase/biotin carboxylase 1
MGKGSNDALAEKFHIENIMKPVDSSTSLEVLNNVHEAIVRRSQSQRIGELQQSSRKGKFVHAINAFVERYGGSNAITSILMSNNGLAAVKFIRSIRQFSLKNLGDERAISLVAMATPEDMRVGAEHIRMADQIVEVPGGSNNNNYANVRLIVEIAQRVGVDAVWPGWGHASEYPDLPAALKAAGIIFLGPPAEPMAALGDKVGSTILAQAANVPTLAWSGSEISVSYEECNGVIPEDIYKKACINDPEEAAEVCERIGYPVMLKASWGGGGKGIRKVFDSKNVKQIFKQVQAEVPGSPIFAMRLAPKSRHLEVQLLADTHGNVCSLFSRDCSVQRRHQKIVEEGPVTIAPPDELRKMEVAACNLARSVGYVGAATVEYLYLLDTGQVCFLELNPRLQVEHPVTEWISGVNIPSCQLMIGMGIPLWRIPDIRRMYKASPNEDTFIDLAKAEKGDSSGHVVAVRITSEDAEDGFKPTSGSIDELSFRSTPDVWGYFSVKGGGGVHEYADSQFGHLFAKGETRTEAIKHMLVALADIKIRGEIRTTVDYLMDMLQSEGFVNNLVSTSWLDERIEKQVKPESPTWYLAVIGAGVSRAYQILQARMADFISYLEKGQIPGRNTLLEAVHHSVVLEGSKYQIEVAKVGPQTYKVSLNGSSIFVVARALRDGGLLMQLDGKSHVVHAEEQPLGTRLLIGQKTCMIEKERDPSKVVAVTSGKLIRWLVEDQSHVEADEQYAEIEVMKMIMPLVSPAAGKITLEIAEGQQVTPGQLIARIKLDDESSIKIAKVFTGQFPSMGPPMIVGKSSDQKYNDALQSLLLVLAGYEHAVEENISKLLGAIDDPELALKQWQQAISAIEARMPSQLLKSMSEIIKTYETLVMEGVGSDPASTFSARSTPRSLPFPSDAILNEIDEFIEKLPQAEQMQLQITLEPIISVAYIHQGGREAHASRIVRQLLDKFLNVEEIFNTDANLSDIIEDLRHKHKDAPEKVLDIVVSHQALKTKCQLLFGLLSAAIMPNPQKYRTYLRRLVALESKGAQEVALRAKHLLDHSMLADLRAAVARSLSGLEMFHGSDISDAEMEKEKKKKKRHHNSMPESELAALIESDFSLESSSRLVRVATKREGLYSGLEKLGETLEQRMKTLVEAQAAVEDPLASLLDHPDSDIQWRAVETYIKRIYSPYLLESSLQLKAAGGGAILATWCYVEPVATAAAAACSMKSDLHFGIMVILQSLSQFPATVTAAAVAVGDAKKYYNCQMPSKNTMHIALVGNGDSALRLSSNASILFKEMKCRLNRERSFDESSFSSESDSELLTPGMNFLTTLKSAAASAVAAEASVLKSAGFTTVSFVRPAGKILPQRFGFIWNTDDHAYNLVEQKKRKGLWQVEPPQANLLDLQKLKGLASLYCPSRTKQWHLFVVTEKTGVRTAALRRVFLRGLVRKLDISPENRNICSKVIESIQPHLTCALEELERAQFDDTSRARSADWAHIYLSVLPSHLPVAGKDLGHAEMAGALRTATSKLVRKVGALLRRTAVSCWETRLVAVDGTAWRICVSLPSGFESDLEHIDIYREALDQSGHAVYAPQPAAGARPGPLAGHLLSKVYEPLETLQRKRLSARRLRTTYCYDFPPLFETALREIWSKASPGSDLSESTKLLEAEEFVLNETALQNGESIWNIDLVPITRPPGQNNVGMIAWIWTIKVPEKPEGRQIVVIANDASHSAGSFGPKEDAVFKAATELGLKRKLPIIYLSVNSGARFGLAEEVRSKFKVAWVNDTDPAKGFQYLYLDDSDYEKAKASIKAELFVTDHGEKRWIITDVIGAEDGIGVECLSGSGAIATAFSKAYHEGFTLTFVTGRAIGIGAYLARLGHRVVQRVDQPIILTGYAALNKLLGKEVYTSHMQLGGPKVMSNNGVTHCLVEDDISGALEILNWLSYVPCIIGGPLSLMEAKDEVDRDVTYYPEKDEKLDPRAAISGKEKPGDAKERLLGMFDEGEFSELQAGWAKTVITGHARLGGIPVGVVAVEVDTVSMNVPADPGDTTSSERNVAQAGQVWFPDSALKTAQAIEEFDLEGLPLFILANWRGFSGGMRDLFDGVLQNGAKIVEALRVYKNPIYIYLPPKCELRGGAWAVLDTKINPERIEMYADSTARGGVLEPEGMVEIKYRDSQLVKTIHRLDPVVQALKREDGNSSLNPSAKHGNESAILARQQALLQPYRSIAVGFADMHDKAERMRAKGIIRKVVPWKDARRYFYWRLKKTVVEDALAVAIRSTQESMSFKESKKVVSGWYSEFNSESSMEGPNTDWEQEMQELQKFVQWSESEGKKIQSRIETLQAESATRVLKQFMNSDLGPVSALMEAIQQMSQNLQQSGEGSTPNTSAEAKALNVLKETRDRLQNLMVDDGDA